VEGWKAELPVEAAADDGIDVRISNEMVRFGHENQPVRQSSQHPERPERSVLNNTKSSHFKTMKKARVLVSRTPVILYLSLSVFYIPFETPLILAHDKTEK